MAETVTVVPGVSTLEVKLAYTADADTCPAANSPTMTILGRINAIGGVALPTEQIDASALEDTITKYIAGRQDSGGEWAITVNTTDATITAWEGIKGTKKWFEVIIPGLSTLGYWVRAEVPKVLPLSEVGQNELLTMEISLSLLDIAGFSTKVTPSV